MTGSTLSIQPRTSETPEILPAGRLPDLSGASGPPDAAGFALAGGEMIVRLTRALSCAVSSPAEIHVSAATIRSNLRLPLIDLYLALGQLDEAEALLSAATATVTDVTDETSALKAAYLLSRQAEVEYRTGNAAERQTLQSLWDSRYDWTDAALLAWAGSRLALHLSLDGRHEEAIQLLTLAAGPEEHWPPAVHAVAATLMRRKDDLSRALHHLDKSWVTGMDPLSDPQRVLTLIGQAACKLRCGEAETAMAKLYEALRVQRMGGLLVIRRALEELPDLLEHAVLNPNVAPQLTPILPHLQLVGRGAPVDSEQLTLLCLGRAAVLRGRRELSFALTWTPDVLAALVMYPGLTRRELQQLFPRFSPAEAKRAVQTAITELRLHLGPDVVDIDLAQSPPTYRLRPDLEIQVDLVECLAALHRNDLPRALVLYCGTVVPGYDHEYSSMGRRWRDQIHYLLSELMKAAHQEARELDQGAKAEYINSWVDSNIWSPF